MQIVLFLALAIAAAQAQDVCVDTKPSDTCLAWKHFGFCYKGNKAMQWCCATCKSDKVWPGTNEDAAALTTEDMAVFEALETDDEPQSDDVCIDTKPADTCLAWKTFGFCYEGNKAMKWCCATCNSDNVWPGTNDEPAALSIPESKPADVCQDTKCRWLVASGSCYAGIEAFEWCCAKCKGTNDEAAALVIPESKADDVCVDTKPSDTCLAWKHFGFCYKGNKAMQWCCATCKSDKVWPGTNEDAVALTTLTTEDMAVFEALETDDEPQSDDVCIDTKPADTCLAWKTFGFCYEGNKAMKWCCATCNSDNVWPGTK